MLSFSSKMEYKKGIICRIANHLIYTFNCYLSNELGFESRKRFEVKRSQLTDLRDSDTLCDDSDIHSSPGILRDISRL